MSARRSRVLDWVDRMAFASAFVEGRTVSGQAYAAAAQILRKLPRDLDSMLDDQSLFAVKGLSKSARALIEQAARGDPYGPLLALESQIPNGVFSLREIRGLGPARLRTLVAALGITTAEELHRACLDNRLITIDGFGKKMQDTLQQATEQLLRRARLLLRHTAQAQAVGIQRHLETLPDVLRVVLVGDLARGHELVETLSFLIVTSTGKSAGSAIDEIRFEPPPSVDVVLSEVADVHAGYHEIYHTADVGHRTQLEQRALERNLCFDATFVAPDAQAAYARLGAAFVPAERRVGEASLLDAGKLVAPLISRRDLLGALHNHTVASDGRDTLDTMRAAASSVGLTYLGISEHSVSADYAGGLSAERLLLQLGDVVDDRGSRESNGACSVLLGVESDIQKDGSLDYADSVLAQLDFIVASVHQRFGLDADAATRRLVTAAEHPFTDVIGHPTGRLLLSRDPMQFDLDLVLAACKRNDTAIELNASPQRLDLCAAHLARAKEHGVLVSIAADAHAHDELGYLDHGIAIARAAGLTAYDVLNARPLSELTKWLACRRQRRGYISRWL